MSFRGWSLGGNPPPPSLGGYFSVVDPSCCIYSLVFSLCCSLFQSPHEGVQLAAMLALHSLCVEVPGMEVSRFELTFFPWYRCMEALGLTFSLLHSQIQLLSHADTILEASVRFWSHPAHPRYSFMHECTTRSCLDGLHGLCGGRVEISVCL